jgi:hypothetical protein
MGKILYLNYYKDGNAERQKEIERCLEINLNNEHLQNVIIISDTEGLKHISEKYQPHKKIYVYSIDHRPTYQDFFDLVNKISDHEDISIIANTDIFFDDSIALLDKIEMDGNCIALSRWDVLADGKANFHCQPGSQDVWIFKGKIKPMGFSSFCLGKRGCDNRIAYEIERAGYTLYNPSRDIIAYHLHITGIRNYSFKDQEDLVPMPYKYIGISSINNLLIQPESKKNSCQQ